MEMAPQRSRGLHVEFFRNINRVSCHFLFSYLGVAFVTLTGLHVEFFGNINRVPYYNVSADHLRYLELKVKEIFSILANVQIIIC